MDRTTATTFYRTLPQVYRWAGVRTTHKSEAEGILFGPDDPLVSNLGAYYNVCSHGEVAVKTSKDYTPLLDSCYRCVSLTRKAEGTLDERERGDRASLLARFPGSAKEIAEAFIRAKTDVLYFEQLCGRVPARYLVEQSCLLVWEETSWGRIHLNEILFQPFIEGVLLTEVIGEERSSKKAVLRPPYEELALQFGPQLKDLVDAAIDDFSLLNFILTPDGWIVFLDYQPVQNMSAQRTRAAIRRMLMDWEV